MLTRPWGLQSICAANQVRAGTSITYNNLNTLAAPKIGICQVPITEDSLDWKTWCSQFACPFVLLGKKRCVPKIKSKNNNFSIVETLLKNDFPRSDIRVASAIKSLTSLESENFTIQTAIQCSSLLIATQNVSAVQECLVGLSQVVEFTTIDELSKICGILLQVLQHPENSPDQFKKNAKDIVFSRHWVQGPNGWTAAMENIMKRTTVLLTTIEYCWNATIFEQTSQLILCLTTFFCVVSPLRLSDPLVLCLSEHFQKLFQFKRAQFFSIPKSPLTSRGMIMLAESFRIRQKWLLSEKHANDRFVERNQLLEELHEKCLFLVEKGKQFAEDLCEWLCCPTNDSNSPFYNISPQQTIILLDCIVSLFGTTMPNRLTSFFVDALAYLSANMSSLTSQDAYNVLKILKDMESCFFLQKNLSSHSTKKNDFLYNFNEAHNIVLETNKEDFGSFMEDDSFLQSESSTAANEFFILDDFICVIKNRIEELSVSQSINILAFQSCHEDKEFKDILTYRIAPFISTVSNTELLQVIQACAKLYGRTLIAPIRSILTHCEELIQAERLNMQEFSQCMEAAARLGALENSSSLYKRCETFMMHHILLMDITSLSIIFYSFWLSKILPSPDILKLLTESLLRLIHSPDTKFTVQNLSYILMASLAWSKDYTIPLICRTHIANAFIPHIHYASTEALWNILNSPETPTVFNGLGFPLCFYRILCMRHAALSDAQLMSLLERFSADLTSVQMTAVKLIIEEILERASSTRTTNIPLLITSYRFLISWSHSEIIPNEVQQILLRSIEKRLVLAVPDLRLPALLLLSSAAVTTQNIHMNSSDTLFHVIEHALPAAIKSIVDRRKKWRITTKSLVDCFEYVSRYNVTDSSILNELFKGIAQPEIIAQLSAPLLIRLLVAIGELKQPLQQCPVEAIVDRIHIVATKNEKKILVLEILNPLIHIGGLSLLKREYQHNLFLQANRVAQEKDNTSHFEHPAPESYAIKDEIIHKLNNSESKSRILSKILKSDSSKKKLSHIIPIPKRKSSMEQKLTVIDNPSGNTPIKSYIEAIKRAS